MCCFLTVTTENKNVGKTEIAGGLLVGIRKKFFSENIELQISEDGNCACSLLSDDADWNSPIWRLREEKLTALRKTLEFVAKEIDRKFGFEAKWIGESATKHKVVSIDELCRLVDTNEIANFTSYQVIATSALDNNG